jgi:acetate kinase
VLEIMETYADVCPAHNPPYMAAMRAFMHMRPELPLVAAFETGFHQTIPVARATYGIPLAWTVDFGIRRYGFHGASHAYVAAYTAALMDRGDLKVISCHLGGSSSVCALAGGVSVANSFGVATQSGMPHNNRVGDFDAYALPLLARRTGKPMETVLDEMATRGGLLGICGKGDMQAVLSSAASGDERAVLARDVFVESVRHYIGAYLLTLGGLDALVFTGGIGEKSPEIRTRVCADLAFLGIELDPLLNGEPVPDGSISAHDAAVRVLAIETNEELIVARHAQRLLESESATT